MKYVHLDNPAGSDRRFNLGDDIQVLAAKRFVPEFDGYMTRSELASYRGEKVRIILNGWFMHDPTYWPPSEDVEPLLVSFHMNPVAAEAMLRRGRAFFERSAPIGCRDYQTMALFKAAGIDAYYTGCLTLSLERDHYIAEPSTERSGVLAVDVLYKMRAHGGRKARLLRSLGLAADPEKVRAELERLIIDQLVPATKRNEVRSIEHSRSIDVDSSFLRHAAAEEVLGWYANAELVLTSRIHCALPCLAFGTPVIFVDGALDNDSERARLRGIIDLMPILKVGADGSMDFTSLKRDLAPEAVAARAARIADIRSSLEQACYQFIERE